MLYEFKDGQHFNKSKYDFCICGAGVAGITLAIELAQKGARIALLEGGGLEFSEQSQNIYNYKSVGMQAWLQLMRLRYLGGTSNHWSGRCRPFDESDFEEKTINGLPGWPIRREEIDGYLEEALTILDLKPESPFSSIKDNPELKKYFYPDYFALGSPTRFGKKYFSLLSEDRNIDLFLNANAVEIKLDENLDIVSGVAVKNYTGYSSIVRADNFILCMGGVENARILLCSDKQIKSGIGNHAGLVGACFMEHLNVQLGKFIYSQVSGIDRMEFYTSNKFSRSRNIGKSNVTFSVVKDVRAYGRTKKIKEFFQKLACEMGVEEKVQFIAKFNCPGEGVITTLCEQSPDKNSRVYLDEEQDSLGMRKLVHDWSLNDRDQKTIRMIAIEIAKQFAQADLGRVKLNDYILDDSLSIPVNQHAHHMGTTRMSEKPEHGVVDRNCKVFDTGNLFIAGSSIFSTGGMVNPTMPIVQFTLRLADFLSA